MLERAGHSDRGSFSENVSHSDPATIDSCAYQRSIDGSVQASKLQELFNSADKERNHDTCQRCGSDAPPGAGPWVRICQGLNLESDLPASETGPSRINTRLSGTTCLRPADSDPSGAGDVLGV